MISNNLIINLLFAILVLLAVLLFLYAAYQFAYGSLLRMHTTLGNDLLLNMRSRSSTVGSMHSFGEPASLLPDSRSSSRSIPGSLHPSASSASSGPPSSISSRIQSSATKINQTTPPHPSTSVQTSTHTPGTATRTWMHSFRSSPPSPLLPSPTPTPPPPSSTTSRLHSPTGPVSPTTASTITAYKTTGIPSTVISTPISRTPVIPLSIKHKVETRSKGFPQPKPLRKVNTDPMFKLPHPPKPIGFKLEDIFCKEVLQKPQQKQQRRPGD